MSRSMVVRGQQFVVGMFYGELFFLDLRPSGQLLFSFPSRGEVSVVLPQVLI